MKKLTLISAALLILGAVLFISGYMMSGRDLGQMDIDTSFAHIDFTPDGDPGDERTYFASDISGIVVNTTSADVTVGLSADDLVHVYCPDGSDANLDPVSGALTVSQSPSVGFRLFSLDFTGGGDIEVLIPGSLVPDVDVISTSGDTYLDGVRLAGVSLSATSGCAYISALECDKLSFGATSGDAYLKNVAASSISLVSTSGDAVLDDVDAQISISVTTTSGDVLMDGVDAGKSIHVNTTSGDISGALTGPPSDYTVFVSTVSGDTSPIPDGRGPKALHVTTTSGDIDLTFNS